MKSVNKNSDRVCPENLLYLSDNKDLYAPDISSI